MEYIKDTCGVVLFRAQPVHNTHIKLIKEALDENDKVYVVIGSSDKFKTKRNPLSYKQRKKYLNFALDDLVHSSDNYKKALNRIVVLGLYDYTSEDDTDNNVNWGRYLYYNLVSRTGLKDFNLYYCDKPEIIEPWFESEVKEHINLKLYDRETWGNGVSATNIRNALLDLDKGDNLLYLRNNLPKLVFMHIDEISKIMKPIYMEDKTDGKG